MSLLFSLIDYCYDVKQGAALSDQIPICMQAKLPTPIWK